MSFGAAKTPAFGTATTQASGGLFGSTGFNTTTTTTSSGTGFGGFGGFGGGGFGTNTSTASSTGFGFGTSTTQSNAANPGFKFGQTATGTNPSTGTSFFSGAQSTPSTGLFGGGASTGTSSTMFGGTQTGTGSLFGTASTGAIGATTSALNPLAANQQNTANQNISNMATAVSLPLIFGDERDAIIAKWNQLQAFWGTGKGFFNAQGNSAEFKADNIFCRFKAVGYSCMPKSKNRDGFCVLIFNKKVDEVTKNQQQIVDLLSKIFGSPNRPNLSICVETVKSLPDDKTEMIVYVQERSNTGNTKRFTATEVFAYLNSQKAQLVPLSIDNVFPKTGFTHDQLQRYLDNPPAGIDPLIWEQAKMDNPDHEKLIPVPMIGFTELQKRLKHQEQQTKLHQSRIEVITDDISNLQRNQTNMLAKIEQYKRKYLELGHRVLKVMTRQEVYRKLGYAIQAEEEQLKVQLDAIQNELNAPTQFKGRLNELMSQIRMQNHLGGIRADATYQMDSAVQQEVKQHLGQQQQGLQHLISIIKDDLEDLKVIEEGLGDVTHYRS